jgi:hypothetical protein
VHPGGSQLHEKWCERGRSKWSQLGKSVVTVDPTQDVSMLSKLWDVISQPRQVHEHSSRFVFGPGQVQPLTSQMCRYVLTVRCPCDEIHTIPVYGMLDLADDLSPQETQNCTWT